MRLMHPYTVEIVTQRMKDEDFKNSTVSRKQFLSHSWCEVTKYMATRQKHPKMWLNDYHLGVYMRMLMFYNEHVGCNLDEQKLVKYDDLWYAYVNHDDLFSIRNMMASGYGFDNDYLFSDAVSLYFKGLNIFPYIYGESWRRYVPIESLQEINRVVEKTINKKNSEK